MPIDSSAAKVPAARSRSHSKSRQQALTSVLTTPLTCKLHCPSSSILDIIRGHPRLRLYVDPMFWTEHHVQLLDVDIYVSETILSQSPHRLACPKCSNCGRVSNNNIALVQRYPYRIERDDNLARLIHNTTAWFCTPFGTRPFKATKEHHLPFNFGGKRRGWVSQAVTVRDNISGMPLLALTHQSSRHDAFDARFPYSYAGLKTARSRFAATITTDADVHPHDVAVLIAMCQKSQDIQSQSQGDKVDMFTLTLITPNQDRTALYVYSAYITSKYHESFVDPYKPLEGPMHISRSTIPLNDPSVLLETLGQILNVHQKLEIAVRSILDIEKENRPQKHAGDTKTDLHPIK